MLAPRGEAAWPGMQVGLPVGGAAEAFLLWMQLTLDSDGFRPCVLLQ